MARKNSNADAALADPAKNAADARRNKLVTSALSEIIAHIESDGLMPWNKPWKSGTGGRNILLPRNASTGVAYSGGNRLILADRLMRHHWKEGAPVDNRWLTKKQALTLGGVLRADQENDCATLIKIVKDTFTKEVEKPDGTKEDKVMGRTAARVFNVYHVSQYDGLEIDPPEPVVRPVADPDVPRIELSPLGQDAIAALVKKTNLTIRHGADVDDLRRGAGALGSVEDAAFYSPGLDLIHMPRRELFAVDAFYFDTLFHEIGHSTMAPHRMDRKKAAHAFGTDGYAMEELVADLASAFLGAEIDLPAGEPRLKSHAAYIKGWAKQLKSDPQALFTAARVAEKICDYVVSMARDYRQELDQTLFGPRAPATVILPAGSALDATAGAAIAAQRRSLEPPAAAPDSRSERPERVSAAMAR